MKVFGNNKLNMAVNQMSFQAGENFLRKVEHAGNQHSLPFRQFMTIFSKKFFLKPITRRQIFDSSKLKEFADDSFKFNENGRKLSKWVENTVGKGEIAHYKQYLLFPQCFQKACFRGASKGVIVWEWINKVLNTGAYLVEGPRTRSCIFVKQRLYIWYSIILYSLTLSQTNLCFYVSVVQVFLLNTVGTGEIAGNEQFLLFQKCFLTVWRTFCHLHEI